jgi:hypothetical protein
MSPPILFVVVYIFIVYIQISVIAAGATGIIKWVCHRDALIFHCLACPVALGGVILAKVLPADGTMPVETRHSSLLHFDDHTAFTDEVEKLLLA